VDFIVVGGLAGAARGLARATYDVDVCYARGDANLARVVAALEPVHPYLRGAPPGLPFRWDADTLRRGLNFTLTTDAGAIDILGEISGVGDYDALLPHTTDEELFGVSCRCATLPALIRMKRAAGRPKDNEVIAELEALLEETRRDQS
jgi:hypothetical protein